jgi:hypothetical protein
MTPKLRHGHSFILSENEDGTEKKKGIENLIWSHSYAFKDIIKRESVKEEIIDTNEIKEINWKATESLSDVADDIKQQLQNFHQRHEELHCEKKSF